MLGFAAGAGGITLFGVILTQMDKVVLSKVLPLDAFGYYVLAATVAGGLQLFIRPVYTAVFPRLSALVASEGEVAIAHAYHWGSQLMATLVAPG